MGAEPSRHTAPRSGPEVLLVFEAAGPRGEADRGEGTLCSRVEARVQAAGTLVVRLGAHCLLTGQWLHP